MGEWIPPTRTTPGRYVADDELPKRDLRTCRERQDAAIEDLQVSAGYAQAADERLTRAVEDLTQRITALEEVNAVVLSDLMARISALEERVFAAEFRAVVKIDPATITWTTEPQFVHSPGYEQEETP